MALLALLAIVGLLFVINTLRVMLDEGADPTPTQEILLPTAFATPTTAFTRPIVVTTLPPPTPRTTITPTPRQTRHTVQRGDTLFRIAQQYGVTVDAIIAANELTNPDRLLVGEELIIPVDES